ncbi:hypothetical protein FF011L_44630 [Roseimaritima multifibrata]|uniref:Uncharacterized protein n=1 Tax=Roseimaritima multifibrata TaxID=1930274 RepID=A0A517MLA8_9BACT|nr:hypothetical protein [Roseimaritima multifibrata]QDS95663.1 hypothetical protein FF011L_44630 [Roseimaritima multifibrata]
MYFPVEIFVFPIAAVVSVWVVGLPLGRILAGRALNRRGKKLNLSTVATVMIGLFAMAACLGASVGTYVVLYEYALPPRGFDAVTNELAQLVVILLCVMAQICVALATWYLAYHYTALPAHTVQQQRLSK